MDIYDKLARCTTPGEVKRMLAGNSMIMLPIGNRAEIEKWLITIEAHCAVIAIPDITDDIGELVNCIRLNVAEIRRQLQYCTLKEQKHET